MIIIVIIIMIIVIVIITTMVIIIIIMVIIIRIGPGPPVITGLGCVIMGLGCWKRSRPISEHYNGLSASDTFLFMGLGLFRCASSSFRIVSHRTIKFLKYGAF